MKKTIISLGILILIVIGMICFFNKNESSSNGDKKQIVTTIYPIYDFTKEIAGDKLDVSMLLSPGVEVHDYEPTPQDIIKIQNSDLFLYMGEELEPWAKTVISGIDNKENLKNAADGISLIEKEKFEEEYGIEDDESHGHEDEKYDTHIWLDPMKSIELVKNITNYLINVDPSNENYYLERSQEYISKIEKLDSDFEDVVKNSSRNEIAFAGPFSYSYFIKRYGLKFVTAYDSCGENGEPSVDKIFNVIKEIKENNLPVVFYKELSSGNIVRTVSDETGAIPLEFNSLHSLTKEQMENGESYLTIMNKNLENLKKALN